MGIALRRSGHAALKGIPRMRAKPFQHFLLSLKRGRHFGGDLLGDDHFGGDHFGSDLFGVTSLGLSIPGEIPFSVKACEK